MSSWWNWKYKRVPSLLAAFTSRRIEPFSLLIPTSTGSKPVFFTMLSIWSRFVPLSSCIRFIAVCVKTCLEEQLCETLIVLAPAGQRGEGWGNLLSIFTCIGHRPWMLACSMPRWTCLTSCLCGLFLSPMISDTTGMLRDHWLATLVFWLVSTSWSVTGSSSMGVSGCFAFGDSDSCLLGSCGLPQPPEMFLPIALPPVLPTL